MVDLIQKLLNILFSLDVVSQNSVKQVSANTPNFEDILKELIESLKNSSENFDEIIKKILQSDKKDFSDSLQDLLKYLKGNDKSEPKGDDVSKSQDDLFIYPLHIMLNFLSGQQTKLQEGNVNSSGVQSNQSQGVSQEQKSISNDGKQIILEGNVNSNNVQSNQSQGVSEEQKPISNDGKQIILDKNQNLKTKLQEGNVNSSSVQSNQSQLDKNQNLIAENTLREKIENAEPSIDEKAQKEKIKVSSDSFHKIDKQAHQTDEVVQDNQMSENHGNQMEKPEKFGEVHRGNAGSKFQSDFFGEKKEIKDINQGNSHKDSARGEFQIKEDKLLTKEISSKSQEVSQSNVNKSELVNLAESSGEKRGEKDFISTAQKLHTPLHQDNNTNNIQDNKSNNISEIVYNSRSDSKIPELKQVILDSVKFVLNAHQKRAVMEADVLGSKVIIDVAVDNSNKLSLSITTPDTSLKADISKHQDELRRFLEGNNFILQRFDVNSGFDENLNRENIFHFRGFNSSPNLNHFADEEKFSRGTVFANIKGRFLAIA